MPQEKPGKGSTKKRSTEQKSSLRSQPSTANSSNWNVKQVVGGVAGVLCLIIVIAAVVQQKRGTSNHASMNYIFLCHVNPNYLARRFCFSFCERERNHCKQPSVVPLSMCQFVMPHLMHLMSVPFVCKR